VVDKEEAIIWKNRGNSLAKQGNYEGALSCYNIGLGLDPANIDILHNKSIILTKIGKIEKPEELEKKSKKSIITGVSDLIGSVGGAIKAGARRVSYELLLRKHKDHIKRLIVKEFDLNGLKQICEYFDIRGPNPTRMTERGDIVSIKPTREHWEEYVVESFKLSTLKDYARKKCKLSHEIIELEEKYREERLHKYPEYANKETTINSQGPTGYYDNELLQELIQVIKDYQPVKPFKNEFLYQTNLCTYLQGKIPGGIGFEVQKGSSRPDLVVGEIAIEIKGPTDHPGLKTIADKINRYSLHWEYLIVVLFDVQVRDRLYNEWYESIMRKNEGVTIIRK
jgi:tetratricopeptide (TPR) repeat protein